MTTDVAPVIGSKDVDAAAAAAVTENWKRARDMVAASPFSIELKPIRGEFLQQWQVQFIIEAINNRYYNPYSVFW